MKRISKVNKNQMKIDNVLLLCETLINEDEIVINKRKYKNNFTIRYILNLIIEILRGEENEE